MEINAKRKIFLLTVSVSFQLFYSLAAPSDDQLIWRNKRTNTNYPETVTGMDDSETTRDSNDNTDMCNISDTDDSESGRNRRSILYLLDDVNPTEGTIENTTDSIDISHLSDEFKNCSHIYLENGCYEKLHNGSVFVPLYSMVFDKSNYLINQEFLFICPNFFGEYHHEEKFSEYIQITSLVCSGISSACLILHIAMFIVVKKLRNLPGYCLLSLCVALLDAYFCTFIQRAVMDIRGCTVLGMFLLYFLLAAFFWMNVFSYDVWRSIRMATTKLRTTTDRPIMVRFARYSLYGWGMPLMIVISSIIIHFSTSNIKYKLIFSITNCWFQYKQALTLYFAGPLFLLLGINAVFFCSSFMMISTATMTKKQSKAKENSDLRSRLFLSLRLGSVMGFMWVFGILAAITKQLWLWYLYATCSALQGVFIFTSFTMSERSRKICRKAMQSKKYSGTPTQSSSQPTTFH